MGLDVTTMETEWGYNNRTYGTVLLNEQNVDDLSIISRGGA